jgi:hypothetical protein
VLEVARDENGPRGVEGSFADELIVERREEAWREAEEG